MFRVERGGGCKILDKITSIPELTRERVKLAYATAIVVDILQVPAAVAFFTGALAVPAEAVDAVLDAAAAGLLNWLLGYHWALLPTFVVKLIPGLDAAPTWTACVAYVVHVRKKQGEYAPGEQKALSGYGAERKDTEKAGG